jgi:4-amino-4-deoxy-L-arabinose transferase-like glycosyltransferase
MELAFFGTSLIGFRFFAAIAGGFAAVLTGFMAQAMGGGRQAMLVSAFAASIAGPVFFTSSFMSYMSFDLLWWVAVAWCVSRMLQSDDARWWLGIGSAIGLGLMTKYTMAFFAVALLGAMLLAPTAAIFAAPGSGAAWLWRCSSSHPTFGGNTSTTSSALPGCAASTPATLGWAAQTTFS